jgi:UDP-N-acetyl-D-glucosamine dehydrogenase
MVVGQGYVGLPLAVRAATVGFDVSGVEPDPHRYASLQRAESYIGDVSTSALQRVVDDGRYRPFRTVAEAGAFDVAVIAVATPLSNGIPDLGQVRTASAALAARLRPGATVILESTSYPGTTEEVVAPILEKGSRLRAGDDFRLGFSPERIDPGNPSWHFEDIPKLVSGVDERSLEAVADFYAKLVSKVVPVSGTREAELAKLIENTFRQINVAFVNELAMLAHGLGVDIWAALDAAATKPFGYLPFRPGPGIGGHCLPVDPTFLSWHAGRRLGRPSRFVELAKEIHGAMPGYVTERLVSGMRRRSTEDTRYTVLVVGASYKAGTGDTRNAPATTICGELRDHGISVLIADPHVSADRIPPAAVKVELTAQTVARVHAVLLLVAHPDVDLAPVAGARYVLDCCHCVFGPTVEHL